MWRAYVGDPYDEWSYVDEHGLTWEQGRDLLLRQELQALTDEMAEMCDSCHQEGAAALAVLHGPPGQVVDAEVDGTRYALSPDV